MLCFLETPILKFALLPYCQRMVLYNNLNSGSFIVIFFLVILNRTLHGECIPFKIWKTEIYSVELSSKYTFCPKVSIGKTNTTDPRKNTRKLCWANSVSCFKYTLCTLIKVCIFRIAIWTSKLWNQIYFNIIAILFNLNWKYERRKIVKCLNI